MTSSPARYLIVALAFLVGCATANRYAPPTIDTAAKLSGSSVRNGLFDWRWVGVQSVNDQYVAAPFMASLSSVKVKLAPEKQRLLIQTAFNRQFGGGGPYEAFVPLEFTPVPNGDYRLHSKVRDNVIEVWVEDVATKTMASEVFAAPFRPQPQTNYIPIIVPASR